MASQASSFFELHEGGEQIVGIATTENWKNPSFLDEIIQYVCALLNTVGIMRCILFDCQDLETKGIDKFKQSIENKIKQDLGPNILLDYVHIKDIFDECEDHATKFTCVVDHCTGHLCSLQYSLFFPAASQVVRLNSQSIENIMIIINNPWKSRPSELIKVVEGIKLKINERFTKNESDVIQFKYFKQEDKDKDKEDWKKLCDKIDNADITHYISAFANHHGGRIYYGIGDEGNPIKGQKLKASDQQNITNEIQRILKRRMVWGKYLDTKPELGTNWDIQYLPVYQDDGAIIEDLFVIAVSVCFFPSGVFTQPPESYEWKDGKPVLIDYQEWRRRVQVPNECYHRYFSIIDRNAREECFQIINEVTRQVDSGIGDVLFWLQNKLIEFGVDDESQEISDPKVITCYLQIAYYYYNFNMLKKADDYMEKGNECFKSVKNRPVLELHYSCLLASLAHKRGLVHSRSYQSPCSVCAKRKRMGFLDKSLRLTYECLAESDAVLPGWENAIVWKTHGHNLAAMASCEEDPYRKKKLLRDAENAWCKAIEHAQKVVVSRDSQYGRRENEHALMNIIQRCHLYIALLHLGLSPSGEDFGQERDVNDAVTESIDVRKVVIERVGAVEVTRKCGYPYSNFTKCLVYLVRSLEHATGTQIAHSKHCMRKIVIIRYLLNNAIDLANRFNCNDILCIN